ncbi:unnamed protein product [Cuscuta europaea]|uniref:Uncharacterized protein n=1 Tax=Cuscuta europaea TaxID=41803 RepID=A0A9P0ZFI7_CUSEU|nr:unnamed protein product [Cuscuta europaea]
MKNGLPRRTLRVIVEPGLQDVLQILRVAGDRDQALFPGQEGDGANAGLVRSAAGSEVVGDPVMHTFGVLDEAGQAAQKRPNSGSLQGS